MARRMTEGSQTRPAKYVFAASQADDHDEPEPTKVCPRCGQLLFADMDVCYGCLYDFSRNERRAVPPPALERGGRGKRAVPDPLEAIEIDEIDDDAPTPPRHSRGAAPDDTIDLAQAVSGMAGADLPPGAAPRPRFDIVIGDEGMQVRLPLAAGGITVGRNPSSDVVLRSRSVSRAHLRLVPVGDGVLAQDLGATNPATVGGVAIDADAHLGVGDEAEVCGVTFLVAAHGTT